MHGALLIKDTLSIRLQTVYMLVLLVVALPCLRMNVVQMNVNLRFHTNFKDSLKKLLNISSETTRS